MMPAPTDTEKFLSVALSSLESLSETKNSFSNIFKKGSLQIFENPLTLLGKTLDLYMKEIAFDSSTSPNTNIDNENIIVKNEILAVFNKSKLNPDQFANLLLTNNIYITDEKPGDWTRLKINNIEEYLYGLRNEIVNEDKEEEEEENTKNQAFQYNTKIRQRFDI
jgi:hypothetical protein